MGRLPPCSSKPLFTKRIWTVSFSFSSMIVSFKDGPFEGKTRSTSASTFWLSSGMDSAGLSSMTDVSTDLNGVSARFSTSDGLSKSFLYPGGSRSSEAGRSSKTLLASSRKGQLWTAWSLSLVDGVLSTWSSEVDDVGLCKQVDQSLKVRGMQGQSRW